MFPSMEYYILNYLSNFIYSHKHGNEIYIICLQIFREWRQYQENTILDRIRDIIRNKGSIVNRLKFKILEEHFYKNICLAHIPHSTAYDFKDMHCIQQDEIVNKQTR